MELPIDGVRASIRARMARELDIRNQVRYTVKLGLYSEHAAQQLFGLRDETDERVKVRRGGSKVEWKIKCPSLPNDVFGAKKLISMGFQFHR